MGKRRIVEGNGRDDSGLEKIGEGRIMVCSREKEEEGMIMNGNGEDDSELEKSGRMERTEGKVLEGRIFEDYGGKERGHVMIMKGSGME